jgi:hypothetical protein
MRRPPASLISIKFSSSESDSDVQVHISGDPPTEPFVIDDDYPIYGSSKAPSTSMALQGIPSTTVVGTPPPSDEIATRIQVENEGNDDHAPDRPTVPRTVDAGPQIFTVAWNSSLRHQKCQLRLCANDQPLLFARPLRGKPACWLVVDKETISSPADGGCRGQLFHGKRRFWLQLRDVSDYEFGFSLYDTGGRHVARAFRVVVARNRPYAAPSKDRELAYLAKKGTAETENFITYASKLPRKTEDGKYLLSFGNAYVLTSVKNFIVEDENGKPLFMIYRSSSGTCTLKAWSPLTPIIAFGWAVAIITTDT